MKTYTIKTRNWHGNKAAKKLLDLSLKFGAVKNGEFTDNDEKYFYETNSLLAGLLVLAYWLALARWTGGWTYIAKWNKQPNFTYKIFYL
jgi:hypothetical protein